MSADAAGVDPRRPFKTLPHDRLFFGGMSVLVGAVVLTGFASIYGPKLVGDRGAVPAIIHLHGAVFTSWLLLFVAQTTLVSRGRVDLHRVLGWASVALVVLMLIVGTAATIAVTRAGHSGAAGVIELADPASFLLLNLSALFVFGTLFSAGLYFRRRPQAHKRLMLMATVAGLMPPGVARLPLIRGHLPAVAGVAFAFMLAGPIYDLVSRRRLHPAYVWAFVVTIPSLPPCVAAFGASALWHRIAASLL